MAKKKTTKESVAKIEKKEMPDKSKLSSDQYHVMFEKGTEMPFTGEYVHTKDSGVYKCAYCGTELFSSNTKFDSGTGWPSFTDPVNLKHITLKEDKSLFMSRTEVICKTCGGHLGHVFNDGPGGKQRYCINSCSLSLDKKELSIEKKAKKTTKKTK